MKFAAFGTALLVAAYHATSLVRAEDDLTSNTANKKRFCSDLAVGYPYPVETSGSAWPIVRTRPSIISCGSMHYEFSADGMILRMTGTIALGDAALFKIYAEKAGPSATVYLNSPAAGHSLTDSLETGRWLNAYSFSTHVPAGKQCLGGCVLVWAAGSSKSIGKGATVGFVSPHGGQPRVYDTTRLYEISEYLRKLQYQADFGVYVNRATLTKPYVMTPSIAKEYGIDVEFDAPDK